MTKVQKGIYRHYKGAYYKVMNVARHSETMENMVVYQALYGDFGLWVRPLEMFCEDIEIDGKLQKRFELIEEEDLLSPANNENEPSSRIKQLLKVDEAQ